MKIFVGLGNFEKRYFGTRHNVGRDFLIWFAEKNNFSDFQLDKYVNAKIAFGKFKDGEIEIVLPETFMNLSGESVFKYLKARSEQQEVRSENLYVFHDDVDMNFGEVKIKEAPSGSGGHNGVESLFKHLGNQDFKRVKIGIIPKRLFFGFQKPSKEKVADFVLKKFSASEKERLEEIFKKVESIL